MPLKPSQSFLASSLKWMRRWRQQAHLEPDTGGYPVSSEDWKHYLISITDRIFTDTFHFSRLRTCTIKGKTVLYTRSLDEILVLRKLNDNIRRSYGIRQPNRQELVRTAKQALKETTPKTIVRIDLAKCFESIKKAELMEVLNTDGRVSHQSIDLLEKMFMSAGDLSPALDESGLPRGVITSTSMAELKLRQLDAEIRRVPGVYLLLRYVDDILVFSTQSESATEQAVLSAVTRVGLKSNPTKKQVRRVGCICEDACSHNTKCPCKAGCICFSSASDPSEYFEYLGYKFAFPRHNKPGGRKAVNNPVFCLLSDKKITRLKTRMHHAFASYLKHPDAELLHDRLRYLTANQAVRQTTNKRSLFNGLSYTHSEYLEPDKKSLFPENRLSSLDRFLQSRLRQLTNSPHCPVNISLLRRASFRAGFSSKIRTKFDGKRVLEIKRCWDNA